MKADVTRKINDNHKTGHQLSEKLHDENYLIQAREENLKTIKTNMIMSDKESEKAEQLKAQFLSNISHEIKTPLNSILSATVLLQQKQLDKETEELVETIHNSGQFLFTLLSDVLDYYKVTSSQLSLDHVNFELKKEVEEIYKVFEKKGKEKKIAMQMKSSPRVPSYLVGDPTRLKQILANLLDNAIKFTPPEGKISLTISSVSFKNGVYEILFLVKDTGIGIAEKDRKSIWKTFSMVDMSLTRENPGTGIGLALSRQLCHLLGGKMSFESNQGEGSTFSFTVKMEAGSSPEKSDNGQRGILDILLVEDNLINQKLTQKILMNQGFHVEVADNGKMAVDKFNHRHYDLIFMDIQMPVMDGMEATRQIRKIEALRGVHHERVKIIALTANSQQQDKENCLAAGMDDYINKPFNVKKFPLILSNLQTL